MTPSEPPVPLATRLRDALKEAGFSQRGFAKAIAAETDAKVEHERRQLLRHLKGENTPEDDRARLYARLLDKPGDYFIDERPTRPVDLLADLHTMVATLTAMIETAEILDRLEALEVQVAELPTADDLKRGLESLRRSIARANRGTGEDPPARSA